jgi:hypothetical protein
LRSNLPEDQRAGIMASMEQLVPVLRANHMEQEEELLLRLMEAA